MTPARSRFRALLDDAPDDAEAVEFDRHWRSWGGLRDTAASVEAVLSKHGLGPGSRVGLVGENRPEHVAVLLGVLASGRCLVMSSPLQPAERLAADLRRTASPVVVASARMLAEPAVLDAAAAHGLVVSVSSTGEVDVVGGSVVDTAMRTSPPGTAVEMLTSGTTGPPKRIPLRDSQLDAALGSSSVLPPDGRLLRNGVSIATAPITHMGGLWAVLGNLYAGRRIAMLTRFQVEPWADLVERHRPRACGLVPAAARAVLDAQVQPQRIASLQAVTCGTTYCPPDLADEFLERYGIRVLMTYGATEFAGAVATWTYAIHTQWWTAKRGSAGLPVSGIDLRVVDEGGDSVATGDAGILEVRGIQATGSSERWVQTSDVARIDADGFLWIVGRADDVIIRGGFKIQPNIIRSVLERHPAVSEAVVVGVPDPRLGAVPVAAVERREGTDPTPEELVAWSRRFLTPYEAPARILVLDALPRTPSAKVSRVDLLELIGTGG